MSSESQDTIIGSKRGLVRRIAGTFRPYKGTVTFIGLLILVTAGLGVVNPVLIRVVFDSALFPPEGGPDLNLLWIIAGVMAAVTIVTGGLGIVQTKLTNEVGQHVMRDLRDSLYGHLQSLSLYEWVLQNGAAPGIAVRFDLLRERNLLVSRE